MSTGSEGLQQLRHFAKRRLANPHGQQLCHYLDGAAWEEALHDRLLVPEEMSLGFYTPFWADYTEEQRLALNHWDFIATYYLGRGLLNHQGKGFETQVASLHHGHPAFTGLSRIHTVDENRHMAVSRMMAASTYTLVSRRAHTGPLYEALNQALRHTVVGYTLSARLTLQQERAMSLLVLPRMRALRGVPRERLEATVDALFCGVSGMQRAENAYMPRFNQRPVERACLSLGEKQALVALIRSLQGNLRFFPEGYVPGREPSEGLPPLDEPESSASA